MALSEGENPKLKPITDIGGGMVQEKEKALLKEIIQKVNDLFEGELTDLDKIDKADLVCTFRDIVKIGARILWGATEQVTPAALEAQHEFICSEYAALCFEKAGVTIPWDGRGFIAPCDFALDPSTSAIGQIDLSAGRT